MNRTQILMVLIVSAAGILGCSTPPPTETVIAHRGNSSVLPENTLAAMKSALRLDDPPGFVELDVQRTKDGKLLVIHDGTLDRTSNGRGPVGEKDLSEIRKLSAGYEQRFGAAHKALPFSTLEEVLDGVRELPGAVMIELKASRSGEEVGQLLHQRGETSRHVIAGFDIENVLAAKMAAPKVRTLFLVSRPSVVNVELARLAGCAIVGMNHNGVTKEVVRAAHAGGMLVWAWTVDDPTRARALRELGVDGIITNCPASIVGG